MTYFSVFTKTGLLLYEKGDAPSFLNDLIRSLTHHEKQRKTIRDMHVFCLIKGKIVYLGIFEANDETLFIRELELYLSEQGEKKVENVAIKKIVGKEKKQKAKQRQWDKIEDDLSLDFSEKGTYNYTIMPEAKAKPKGSYAFSLFSNKINRSVLEQKMEMLLMEKNLNYEIIKKLMSSILCDYDGEDVVDQKNFKLLFTREIKELVKAVNINSFLENIKSRKTYRICFVGVNGVGKSTTLAKLCCYLLQNGLKCYIAACDTFRAGAIEQLKVHVSNFTKSGHLVGFYEKGYGSNDANVAKLAISAAEKENYDVILIDTAGRMHNKKNLMEGLSKIVQINDLDHIIFVGEALVGSESVEHMKAFNHALSMGKRKIDSLIVSKIDAVDDKVGQIVNMSVAGNCPILFLGDGQANCNLVELDINDVVDKLLNC